MRRQRLGYLSGWTRNIVASFSPTSVILLYHRVFDAASDPQRLCVSPKHFADHLDYLRRNYPVLSLKQLSSALRKGRLPRRGVVLTFDDGYSDNLLNAKPLLERYDTPATFFITTGYLGSRREFWWDELERLLLSVELPNTLRVVVDGKEYAWNMGEWAELSLKEISAYEEWNVESQETPTPRHRAYRDLHRLLRLMGHMGREAILTDLRTQIGDAGNSRTAHSVMTPSEILNLSESKLVEIGSHTATHQALATQTYEVQYNELRESKARLEGILGRPVISLAYPYGSLCDVGKKILRIVQNVGYEIACANFATPVTSRSDPFFLPRFIVRDWDKKQFAMELCRFFNA